MKSRDGFVGLQRSVIVAVAHSSYNASYTETTRFRNNSYFERLTFCVIIFIHGIDWKTIIIMGIGGEIVSVTSSIFFPFKTISEAETTYIFKPRG